MLILMFMNYHSDENEENLEFEIEDNGYEGKEEKEKLHFMFHTQSPKKVTLSVLSFSVIGPFS